MSTIVPYWSNEVETSKYLLHDLQTLARGSTGKVLVLDFTPECQLSYELLGREKALRLQPEDYTAHEMILRLTYPMGLMPESKKYVQAIDEYENVSFICGNSKLAYLVDLRLWHVMHDPYFRKEIDKLADRLKALVLGLDCSKVLIGCPTGKNPMAILAMHMADEWVYCLSGKSEYCDVLFKSMMAQVYDVNSYESSLPEKIPGTIPGPKMASMLVKKYNREVFQALKEEREARAECFGNNFKSCFDIKL